jgi:hypothetical protein
MPATRAFDIYEGFVSSGVKPVETLPELGSLKKAIDLSAYYEMD